MRKGRKCIMILTAAIAATLSVCIICACLYFFHLFSTNFKPDYRCFSVLSPDGTQIAAVECEDQGALGGRTYVYIRERSFGNPSPSIKGGKKIIDCGFLYPDEIEIRWIDNDTLEFNKKPYEID